LSVNFFPCIKCKLIVKEKGDEVFDTGITWKIAVNAPFSTIYILVPYQVNRDFIEPLLPLKAAHRLRTTAVDKTPLFA
jgi:hypothetical protein